MQRHYLEPQHEQAQPEAIQALQLSKLKALLAKTWSVNPFYQNHWKAAGVRPESINSLDDFRELIPSVEKQDFLADQLEVPPYGRRLEHALSLGEPLIVSSTSGTSGLGQEIHAQTAKEFEITQQVYAHGLRWAGMKRSERLFLTLPITIMPGGRCEYHGAVGYGLTVYAVGNYNAEQKLDLLRRFRPVALLGTTSYFAHLAAVSSETPPSPGMRVLITGGEHAGFSWLQRLEQVWNAKAYDRYGSAQSGNDHMFACERGIGTRETPGTLHNTDPYHIVEILNSETGRHVKHGEDGEIYVTSLYRTDTPAIRVRMRDRATWHEPGSCPCGRPYSGAEICSIVRMDDVKKVKGVNIWPQAVDDIVFAIGEVDEYQVILKSSATEADIATVRVMPKRTLSEKKVSDISDRVITELRQGTGIGFRVEILEPDSLERSEYKARRWIDQRNRED
jgi:phenylacetate-CoA ligase